MAIDYSNFAIPKVKRKPRPEFRGGRLVLNPANYTKLRKDTFYPGIACGICRNPIRTFEDFTLEHYDGRGMGGGRRDDRKTVPAHFKCNAEKGSKRL